MQNIVFEKPYKFVPPHRGDWWPKFIRGSGFLDRYLRKHDGVAGYECRHVEKLRASLDAGHGILLAPNHCRYSDPLVLGWLTREADCLVYAMASWHLFQKPFMAWAIRKLGGFSVYREGMDRQAIETAINALVEAERPLVIFPEGATTRTNDRLHALLDGVAFMARTAAKKRQKIDGGKVVVHPVALKYFFEGDLKAALEPVLDEIEQRLSWYPQTQLTLYQRIQKLGGALMNLKEIEFFGETRQGATADRQHDLINHLLRPLESEYLGNEKDGPVVPRVKALRMKIMPAMTTGELEAEEKNRRWRQLSDIYLAQQISSYPAGYLTELPSVDRILETVERFEEDLTDKVRVHGHLKVIIDVGDPIEVSPRRDRRAVTDPLMVELEARLKEMMAALGAESPLWPIDK